MQSFRFLSLALAAVLLGAGAAGAFSTDDKTLNDPNGASRFSDPDEQMPVQVLSPGSSSAGYGEQDGNGNPQGPSSYPSTAAPFSPASGYSIPGH